jgi:hypothetical protein
MTLAVAHEEGGRCVVDALREIRPPFSPETVVAEFTQLLKTYRIDIVHGDRYAGEWPRDRFRDHGSTINRQRSRNRTFIASCCPF